MAEWRKTARTILVTAAVTSVFWLSAGAFVIQRYQAERYQAEQSPALARAGNGVVAQGFASSARPSANRVTPPPPRTAGSLTVPVQGVAPSQLTDTFTQARAGGARVHDAIDIVAPLGTPVVAAAAGTIEKLFLSDDGGKTVYIRSPDGVLIYYYAHLDQYAPGLAEGQAVRAGQVIGTVGYTGNANPAAPHLHFAVQRTTPDATWSEPSTPLNPYPLLQRR